MKARRLQPLILPAVIFVLGLIGGAAADLAVGRWQDYRLYGLTRPVADLMLVIGAVWLLIVLVRLIYSTRRCAS